MFQSIDNLTRININEAIKLLRDGFVLTSFYNNQRYIFIFDNFKVNIHTPSFKVSLYPNEFMENFQNFNFSLIENDKKEIVDSLKDVDYYKNIQKKQ